MKLRPADPTVPAHVTQPGPPAPDRLQARRGELRVIEAILPAGVPICTAIGDALWPEGITAAAVIFRDLALGPMRYVMPAFSEIPDRAAFYSQTFAPSGVFDIAHATATYGLKDGEPFIHCHTLWTGEAGEPAAGHILPFEAVLARPVHMTAYATSDAGMTVAPDAETGFDLFGVAGRAENSAQGGRLLVTKIRPNEDLVKAITRICQREGVTRARIVSGIGSTVGAVFDGGPIIRMRPTELLVASGSYDRDRPAEVDIDMILVDVTGRVHRGHLTPGVNPVLICLELFLEVLA